MDGLCYCSKEMDLTAVGITITGFECLIKKKYKSVLIVKKLLIRI